MAIYTLLRHNIHLSCCCSSSCRSSYCHTHQHSPCSPISSAPYIYNSRLYWRPKPAPSLPACPHFPLLSLSSLHSQFYSLPETLYFQPLILRAVIMISIRTITPPCPLCSSFSLYVFLFAIYYFNSPSSLPILLSSSTVSFQTLLSSSTLYKPLVIYNLPNLLLLILLTPFFTWF